MCGFLGWKTYEEHILVFGNRFVYDIVFERHWGTKYEE